MIEIVELTEALRDKLRFAREHKREAVNVDTSELEVLLAGRGLTEQEVDDVAWAARRYTETVTANDYKPLTEARRADRLQSLVRRLYGQAP